MSVEIEKLIDLYEKSLSLNGSKGSTFLSVISKDYHENYLSRLIAYVLSEERESDHLAHRKIRRLTLDNPIGL